MKRWLILACLFLTACAADPYSQIAAGNAALRRTQDALDTARRDEIKRAGQATQSALETQGAAKWQLDQANANIELTKSAQEIKRQEFDQALLSAQATQQYSELVQANTATAQAVQATSTTMAIDMTYQESRAAEQEERRAILAWLLPRLAQIVFALAIVAAAALAVWVWRLTILDAKRRKQEHERHVYEDRFYAARNGTYYLGPGEDMPVLVNQLARVWDIPAESNGNGNGHYQDDEKRIDIPAEPDEKDEIFAGLDRANIRWRAIRAIEWSISRNGDTNYLPGYRALNINSEPWQDIRDYLLQISMVYRGVDDKNRIRYYTRSGTLADVKYTLESTVPSPTPESGQS